MQCWFDLALLIRFLENCVTFVTFQYWQSLFLIQICIYNICLYAIKIFLVFLGLTSSFTLNKMERKEDRTKDDLNQIQKEKNVYQWKY